MSGRRQPSGPMMANCSAPRPEPWNKQFPHARGEAQPHRVSPRIPGVEITNHGNRTSIRRPDRKSHTADAIDYRDAAPRCDATSKCRPSLKRCRSRSPSRGPKEYGSSASCTASGQTMRSLYGSVLLTLPTNRPCGVVGASRPMAHLFSCQRLDFQRAAAGRPGLPPHPGVVRTQDGERITERAGVERFRHARRQTGKFSHVVHDGTCAISWARPCNGTSIQAGRLAAS